SLELQTIKLTPDGLTQTASVFLETSMPTHDDMARFSYARDESTLASPRLCISRGDSINCSGFGPEANGWLLRLPPVLQTLHGFSMPPIALTPMLDKLADTSMGTIGVPVLMVPMLLRGHLGGSGWLKRLGSACTVGSNLFDRWRAGGRMNLALRNGAQAPIVHRHSSSP